MTDKTLNALKKEFAIVYSMIFHLAKEAGINEDTLIEIVDKANKNNLNHNNPSPVMLDEWTELQQKWHEEQTDETPKKGKK